MTTVIPRSALHRHAETDVLTLRYELLQLQRQHAQTVHSLNEEIRYLRTELQSRTKFFTMALLDMGRLHKQLVCVEAHNRHIYQQARKLADSLNHTQTDSRLRLIRRIATQICREFSPNNHHKPITTKP